MNTASIPWLDHQLLSPSHTHTRCPVLYDSWSASPGLSFRWCLMLGLCGFLVGLIGLIVGVSCFLCFSALPGDWSFLRVTQHCLHHVRQITRIARKAWFTTVTSAALLLLQILCTGQCSILLLLQVVRPACVCSRAWVWPLPCASPHSGPLRGCSPRVRPPTAR